MASIGTLLAVLAADQSVRCPLADFARSLNSACEEDDDGNIGDVLAGHSNALVEQEELIAATTEQCTVARDKLRAELHRVEAQLQQLRERKKQVEEQKKLCRLGLNAIVSGTLDVAQDEMQSQSGRIPYNSLSYVSRARNSHSLTEPDPIGDDTAADSMSGLQGANANYKLEEEDMDTAAPPHYERSVPQNPAGSAKAKPQRPQQPQVSQKNANSKDGPDDSADMYGGAGQPSSSASSMMPPKQLVTQRSSRTGDSNEASNNAAMEQETSAKGDGRVPNQRRAAPGGASPSTPRGGHSASNTSRALISMLQMPDVTEAPLLKALEAYETNQFGANSDGADGTAIAKNREAELLPVIVALLEHLSRPRPPVQLQELRIITTALRCSSPSLQTSLIAALEEKPLNVDFSTSANGNSNSEPVAPSPAGRSAGVLCMPVLVRLLNSVNEDVKCEVLECLSLLCAPPPTSQGTAVSPEDEANHAVIEKNSQSHRNAFVLSEGLEPLVNVIFYSTSEAVLERALVFLWSCLLSTTARVDSDSDESAARKDKASGSDAAASSKAAAKGAGHSTSIGSKVYKLGGLRALLDLLYTDSMPILDNVAMSIGYMTREEECKVEMRECGGLEKITATLRHPSAAIQTKIAGAVWNCASNNENRTYLRHVGCIPALLELLDGVPARRIAESADPGEAAAYHFVQENAAGALWNLSVDVENKKQIVDYGGIPILLQMIAENRSVRVIENATGTLWNCSAENDVRPAIRKADGIPTLLSLLSLKPSSSSSSAAPSSSTAVAGKGATTVFTPSSRVNHKVLDNVVGTLRNCAINDQNKPVILESGGVELMLQLFDESIRTRLAYAAQKDAARQTGKSSGSNSTAKNQNLIGVHDVMPLSTLEKLASTLWILTVSPDIKHTVRLCGGISLLTNLLFVTTPAAAASAQSRGTQGGSAAAAGSVIPMSVKEKIVGILRNCSTVQENRIPMVEAGVVRALVAVVRSAMQGDASSRSNGPSQSLQETVASCLWYLSRDDKNATREEGGLQLMCELLTLSAENAARQRSGVRGDRSKAAVAQDSSVVVQEQAAGCLSSLTVNNVENRRMVREHGGLRALMDFVMDKARTTFPSSAAGASGGAGSSPMAKSSATSGSNSNQVSHTCAMHNSLMTIRNSTSAKSSTAPGSAQPSASTTEADKLATQCCRENVQLIAANVEFLDALLYLVDNGNEECAREAALCIRNACHVETGSTPPPAVLKALEHVVKKGAVAMITRLAERAASDSAKRAAAVTLQALTRGMRRT